MAAKKKPAGASEETKEVKATKPAKETKAAAAAPAEEKAGAPKHRAAAAKKPAGAAGKKEAKGAGGAAPAVPLVDTNAAAAVAATLIAKKVAPVGESGAGGAKKPSAAFEQLKKSVNAPHAAVVSNLLGVPQGKKATGGHAEFNKQVGHNQTYGADVNRTGVPRRTPG